jgi:sporulation protein YlmC with PRC-barrel domain
MAKLNMALLIVALGLALVVTNAYSEEQMGTNMGRAFAASEILGVHVRNPQGQILGRISDLIVDSQGSVDLVVLSHGGFLRIGEKETAVPFSALRYDRTDRRLILDVSREKLAAAPAFKKSELSDPRAEDIYRYFGLEPSWSEEEGLFRGLDEPLEAPAEMQPLPYGMPE